MPPTDHPSTESPQAALGRTLLADTPIKAAMARDLVSATRKTSQFKPPEMVLREILCTSWALLDEGFQPGSETDLDR